MRWNATAAHSTRSMCCFKGWVAMLLLNLFICLLLDISTSCKGETWFKHFETLKEFRTTFCHFLCRALLDILILRAFACTPYIVVDTELVENHFNFPLSTHITILQAVYFAETDLQGLDHLQTTHQISKLSSFAVSERRGVRWRDRWVHPKVC